MKATKQNTVNYVRGMLATNETWALKALVRIFRENQTADEQSAETTSHDNGIGFSGIDANFLSSLAKQYISRGSLSPKQTGFVLKKMPKYAGQVVKMSDPTKLAELVEAAQQ